MGHKGQKANAECDGEAGAGLKVIYQKRCWDQREKIFLLWTAKHVSNVFLNFIGKTTNPSGKLKC